MAFSQPSTFSALVATTATAPLKIVTKSISETPATQLLIKVHAAAINPVDTQLWRSPVFSRLPGEKGFGKDFSGVVVKVGEEVKGWKEGDECLGLLLGIGGAGTVAEYILIDPAAQAIVKKPADLSYTDAASIPLVALTAMTCLEWLPTQIGSGPRRVIVRGASGGTGIWAVQLAKTLYNSHVTGICSGANLDFVKGLGADEVIDYTKVNLVPELLRLAQPEKFDLFIDCVGGTDIFPSIYELLHMNASYVTIVGDKTNRLSLGGPLTYLLYPSQIIRMIKGMIWGPKYGCIQLAARSDYLQQVVGLVERGEAKVIVQDVIKGALTEEGQWEKAVKILESGRVRGKIVLEI